MYTAPWDYISAYHSQQKAVFQQLKDSDIDVAALKRSVHGLQSGFVVTCQINVHQWPTRWVQLIIDPLRHQAEALGILWEELMPQEADYNSMIPGNHDDDIEMEDCDDDDVDGDTRPHRQGFTIGGESILGYIRDIRGDQFIDKMFVQVDHKNPIKIASVSDVGALAAKEYHDLPEDKKNNIRLSAHKYVTMVKLHFVEIVGIAWLPLSPGTSKRPATYIWVKTSTFSGHAVILTRSDLGKAIGAGNAERHIESWFKGKGIKPQWRLPSDRLLMDRPLEQSNSQGSRQRTQPTTSTEGDETGDITAKLKSLSFEDITNFQRVLNLLAGSNRE